MTTPARTSHARRSRRSHNPTATGQDRAAKALATADTISQRVDSLIGHLACLDQQQLDTVAEPVLERLSAAVASIHELHILFAGWAAGHTNAADQADISISDDQPTASTGADLPAGDSARTPTTTVLAAQRDTGTGHPSAVDHPRPGDTSDPDALAASGNSALCSGQPPTGPCPDDCGDHLVHAAPSGHVIDGEPRQPAPLDTVTDLVHALSDIPEDTPIRLQHDGKTYTLRMHMADGQLVLNLAEPTSSSGVLHPRIPSPLAGR